MRGSLLFGWLIGCAGSGADETDVGETDADTDTDTDTDSDSDADSDSDSDSDSDTDLGAHTGCATPTTWYTDADHDQHGDPTTGVEACEPLPDTVELGDDCRDDDPEIHPGAAEVCDGRDDDCDAGTLEEGLIVERGVAYPTVQDAIDAAAAGGTVELCSGRYVERVVTRRDVTLRGVLGAAVTTLDGAVGGPTGSTVSGLGGELSLEGLTITGGSGTFIDGSTWGGGVYASRARKLTMLDCVVEGNTAGIGAGLAGVSLFPIGDELVDTVIRDNAATAMGGGFLLFRGALRGVEVTGNTARIGGGGAVWYWEVTADPNTRLHANEADLGGGLYPWDDGQWAGGVIEDNHATTLGGGIYVNDASSVSGVVVRGNRSDGAGGGVAVTQASAELLGSTLAENTAATQGGGLYVALEAELSVRTTTFTANVATEGGGIAVVGADLGCFACDLGAAPADNAPNDVVSRYGITSRVYAGEAGETFACTAAANGCTGL